MLLALACGAAAVNVRAENPPATVPASAAPTGYTVINSTNAGQALVTHKSTQSNEVAIRATLADLASYFGAKVTVAQAFIDTKDHQSGGASFTSTRSGEPIKGLISSRMNDQGTVIVVLYARASASSNDWKALSAPPAAASAPTSGPALALTEYRFPDGTGSIGLAEGYTCNAQTAMGEVDIKGPSDQTITLGFTLSVVTPNSMAIRTQLQLEAQARQLGMRPPPRPLMFVAPFAGPVDTYATLVPQLDAVLKSRGLPQIRLTKLLSQDQTPSSLPNSKAAVANFLFDQEAAAGAVHRQGTARIEVTPISQDSFMFSFSGASSPQEQFEHDRPILLAMANSLKLDDRVVAEKTQQNINAQNQWFAAQQKQHREQIAGYDAQNKAWEQRSLQQSRSNDDFDEVIRGYRTVEDTQSGAKTSVDLGHVDDIVDNLNKPEPGRYRQIPLRDESDPLPGK